jgi:hypothetical protein
MAFISITPFCRIHSAGIGKVETEGEVLSMQETCSVTVTRDGDE